VWLFVVAVLITPLERLWPVRHQKIFRKAYGHDLIYYFLSGLAPKVLFLLPLSGVAAMAHRVAPVEYYLWLGDQPVWLRGLLALIVSEFGAYWGHRWSHEIPLLWRFHALHHSAEEMDWLVNSRAHPVDLLFTKVCGLVPMYLLGLAQPFGNHPDVVPLLVVVIGMAWTFFIHANVKWRFGWLEWVISSPAFHHWHHTNDGPTVINKNYAAMLPWVDKLFGTFYLPKHMPGKYGIDDPFPSTVPEQLLYPFTPPAVRAAEERVTEPIG
jgi:sterol desaturase/sphingolipid hydroxylase (fatty acid hydroxylase superfamily)